MAEYAALQDMPTEKLKEIMGSVQLLLSNPAILSFELHVKLSTLHADISAVLEDRDDSTIAGSLAERRTESE